jgi:hypothetical protein
MHEADHVLPAQEVEVLMRQRIRARAAEQGSPEEVSTGDPFSAVPEELQGL